MQEPPDTVVLGCTHFPLLQEELQQVLPEGTRMIDSGAAIARRTAWLLEHEAPDAKSSDANIAYCMALTPETEQLLTVLRRYGFESLEKLPLSAFCTKETVEIFENRACQRLRTPYNAPPLTRNNGLQAAGSAGFSDEYRREKQNIDSE
jgi:hypothetical protein